jgi:hypothetical protein
VQDIKKGREARKKIARDSPQKLAVVAANGIIVLVSLLP